MNFNNNGLIPNIYNRMSKNINPNEIQTITRSVNIDSLFRDNYEKTKSTNFVFSLKEPMNNVLSIKLTSFEFPNMFYSFSSEQKTNIFTINCYNIPTIDSGGGLDFDTPYNESYIITIPDGNYIAPLFLETLNNYFVNIGRGLSFINFSINELNTHTIFRAAHTEDVNGINPYIGNNTGNMFYFSLDFEVKGMPLYKTAGWNLGFRKPQYLVYNTNIYDDITSTNTTLSYEAYLESESSFGSSIMQYIFLCIDDYQNNFVSDTVISCFENSYLGNNILARITLTSGQNTIVIDDSSDLKFKKRVYFGPTKLDKLHIKVIDRFGDPININKNDFSFVLEVEQLYNNKN